MFRWTILQIGFLEILSIFDHFRNSSKNFSEFWQENFGRVVKTAFYMYIGTFWRKCFSFPKIQKFFLWFSDSERQTCGFLEGDFASVVKVAFSVAKESILMEEKTILFKKSIFISSGFCDCFSYSCQQCYGRLDKFSLCMFRRTIGRISKFFGKLIIFSSFPNFEQSFSEVWQKIFGRVVTTAFCVSRWRFFSIFEGRKWEKFFCRKSCIAIIFRLWTKKILSDLTSIVTAGLSKIRCTCSDEPFNK